MKDMEDRVERLFTDAAECDLIADLSADGKKEAFEQLAIHYREMAQYIQKIISTLRQGKNSG